MRSDCDRCVEINDCDRCADMINDYNRCVDILHFKPTCNNTNTEINDYNRCADILHCRPTCNNKYTQTMLANTETHTHNCLNTIIKPTCKRPMVFSKSEQLIRTILATNLIRRKFLLLLRRIRDRRTILQNMHNICMHILQNMNYICPCYVKSTCMIMH